MSNIDPEKIEYNAYVDGKKGPFFTFIGLVMKKYKYLKLSFIGKPKIKWRSSEFIYIL